MTKIEAATRWMEERANNNYYGYSWGGWGPQDYDCSHAVISAWEAAGVPVKTKGATYTENMRNIFMSCGFANVTQLCNLANGQGMRRGDVLLNDTSHTAMITQPGQLVHARSSEGNNMPGDQSGNEFRVQSYFNYPWNCVLRYIITSDEMDESSSEKSPQPPVQEVPYVHLVPQYMYGQVPLLTIALKNESRDDVKAFQTLCSLRLGTELKIDGYYSEDTVSACRQIQQKYGLLTDGECGKDTWAVLINGKK